MRLAANFTRNFLKCIGRFSAMSGSISMCCHTFRAVRLFAKRSFDQRAPHGVDREHPRGSGGCYRLCRRRFYSTKTAANVLAEELKQPANAIYGMVNGRQPTTSPAKADEGSLWTMPSRTPCTARCTFSASRRVVCDRKWLVALIRGAHY